MLSMSDKNLADPSNYGLRPVETTMNASPTPTVRFEPTLVTPDLAKQLLAHNAGNRKLVRSRVLKHIARIRLGTWKMTHQGVCVAKGGRLLDGQHRLAAIVETGIPQMLVVSYGWDESIYSAIDGGSPRSMDERVQLPRKISEEAVMICRIAGDMSYRAISESAVEAAAKAFSAESELLHSTCNSAARGRSLSTARTAAVLRMSADGDLYAAEEYRRLVLLSADISPVALAMVRQLQSRVAQLHNNSDMLARFWKVFDRRGRTATKIQINDPMVQVAEMREVVIRRMGPAESWLLGES